MGVDRASFLDDCVKAIVEMDKPQDISITVANLLKAHEIRIVTILCLDADISAFALTERGMEIDPDQVFESLNELERYRYRAWTNGLAENLVVELPQSGIWAKSTAVLLKLCPFTSDSDLMFVKTRVVEIGEFSVVLSMPGALARDNRLLAEMGRLIPFVVEKLCLVADLSGSRKLSAKEKQCLYWVSEGKNSEEIADLLKLSKFTVNNYIQNAMRKLGAHSRSHAISKSLRAGTL